MPSGLAIIGPGTCGKDTAAKEIAAVLGWPVPRSTSEAAWGTIWAYWGHARYDSRAAMHEDRRNHRAMWARTIDSYNAGDPARLYREMDERMLVGIRRRHEFQACREAGLFSLAVWIERPGLADETLTVRPADCDVILLNDGTLEEFAARCRRFAEHLA